MNADGGCGVVTLMLTIAFGWIAHWTATERHNNER